MFEDKEDSQLVDIILTNEYQANASFEEIYKRYHKKIFKLIHNSIDNIDDCMDLFQKTFLNVYQNLNKYISKYHFSTWIYKIAVNVVLNHKRYKMRFYKFFKEYKTSQNGVYYPDYIDMIYKEKIMENLHKSIRKLPKRLGLPILLSTIGELKTKEISRIFKISESAVRKRIIKAKKILKNLMEDKEN